MRVPEYRLKTRLNRAQTLALGAALAAAGVACGNDAQTTAIYGAPCNPPECMFPEAGAGGTGGVGGAGGGTAGVDHKGGEGGGSGEGGAAP